MSIPELFICPISLDLFSDPVTLCTGQTYDRPCIQKWLAAGNLTCPVTMQKLQDLSVVPNHTLRLLINRWVQSTHQFSQEQYSSDQLKQTLESRSSTLEEKLQALEQVSVLSEELPNRNQRLIQLGMFQLVLELALGDKGAQSSFVEQALCCAAKLEPFSELGCLGRMLKEEPNLASFVGLLEEGTPVTKMSICQLIQAMAISSVQVREVSIIRGLISLIDHDHDHGQGLELEVSGAGVKSILALCSSADASGIDAMVNEGAINVLVAYIMRTQKMEKNLAGKATRAIELMLGAGNTGKEWLMRDCKNGVRALVKMVFRVCDDDLEGSESAVSSLMMLCAESKEAREEAISGGVVTQLLLLLQSQCSGRSKSKARTLLKLLRSMWTKDPKACVRL